MKKLLLLLAPLLWSAQTHATVFGSPQAVRCPECGRITMREVPVISGNTLGAIYWSDSKCYAPMLPQPPRIVKCPVCGTLLLTEEHYCETPDDDTWVLRTVPTDDCTLSFREYLSAFDLIGDPATACLLALHSYNDLYRQQRGKEAEEASVRAAFVDLAARFIALLDENDPDENLLKAELYRETGDFDRCAALLEVRKPSADKRDRFSAQVLAAARKGCTRVFVLDMDPTE